MLLLKSIAAGLLAAMVAGILWALIIHVLPLLAFHYVYDGHLTLGRGSPSPLEVLMVLIAALVGFAIGFLRVLRR